jgi:hypothetical protein
LQGKNIACTLACNREGWDTGNSFFNFMKAMEVVYRCSTEKLFDYFQVPILLDSILAFFR